MEREHLDVRFKNKNFPEKLEKLKKIYNIKTNTKLIEHIIDLELKRFGLK